MDAVIDLDRPPEESGPGRPKGSWLGLGPPGAGRVGAGGARRRPGARVALLLALAFAAGLPQAPPALVSAGRPVPLPSFCTGTPIPGGRLNIIRGDTFIILDAITNTVVNEGRCPRHTGGG
ncbi:hypothetical protein AB0M46_42645 [Dactylosporangium sp. NPDC051485]|uniref:hypothetical protein n=1 Tax=Dactylosporangium sp. NPDC051485 TaxID=3154846 RepID=UPI00342C6104